MNITQNFQLGYFVFSFFVACVLIYFFHQGFQPIDILYIPVLTVIIFLCIDIVAKFTITKNTESFINENFIDYIPTDNTIEHLTGGFNSDPIISEDEIPQITPVQNNIPTTMSMMDEEEITLTPTPEKTPELTLAPNTTPMMTTPMMTTPMMTTPMMTTPMMTTPMMTTPMMTTPMMTTPMMTTPMMTKSMGDYGTDGGSGGGGGGQMNNRLKPKEDIPSGEDGIDINKFHMDSGLDMPEMSNQNKNATKPINININYNNDRPYTHNDFSQRKFTESSERRRGGGVASACPAGDLLDPVNQTTVNAALSNMNQSYYPAYLENPLNKYQNGTSIKSTLKSARETKNETQKLMENERMNKEIMEEEYGAERKNLLRANPKMESRKEKISKYLDNSLQKICNNPNNDPAPVLLNDVWSEFKPLDLK